MNRKSIITLISCLAIVLLLTNCKTNKQENSKVQTLKLLDTLRKSPESFRLNSAKGGKITGKEGTILKFPPHAFQYLDGSTVKGNVTIKLTEYYSCSDMLLNNLSTVTEDGKLLETGGMINCKAFANEKPVKLKKGKYYSIYFPVNGKKKEDMRLFKLDNDSSRKWKLEGDTIRDTNFGSERFYMQDTVLPLEEEKRLEKKYKQSLEYYLFKAPSFGYKNCDAFITATNDAQLLVESDTTLKPVVRLVYRYVNSIIPGYQEHHKMIKFHPLILNKKAKIFAFSKVGGKIYLAQKDVIIKKGITKVDLEFKEVTLKQLKDAAKSVEWSPNI